MQSMTGYGAHSVDTEKFRINAEIRTLNSKYLDLILKLPKGLNEFELDIRKLMTEKMVRGKVTLTLDFEAVSESATILDIDESLFEAAYKSFSELAKKVGEQNADIFKLATQIPSLISIKENNADQDLWPLTKEVINSAISNTNTFRSDEGAGLEAVLRDNIKVINEQLNEVKELDSARLERIKSRIQGNIKEVLGDQGMDQNRFEQELIYYVEKLDISEEKVRLDSHLNYFIEVIEGNGPLGKKLGFVSQEIGREINTIGSKANDAEIQKHVVLMKEELEKIKEQVLNIL